MLLKADIGGAARRYLREKGEDIAAFCPEIAEVIQELKYVAFQADEEIRDGLFLLHDIHFAGESSSKNIAKGWLASYALHPRIGDVSIYIFDGKRADQFNPREVGWRAINYFFRRTSVAGTDCATPRLVDSSLRWPGFTVRSRRNERIWVVVKHFTSIRVYPPKCPCCGQFIGRSNYLETATRLALVVWGCEKECQGVGHLIFQTLKQGTDELLPFS